MGILRYGLGLLIALLIFWGFYGFIKDDNWLAVSALATLVLAVAAFWAIKQTHDVQKSEKIERLLNEIIEWAEDIRKSSSGSIAPNEIIYDDASMATASQMDFLRLRRIYQDINTKGTYVKAIAKVYRGNLLSVTESVICKLDEIIKILKDCLTTRTTRKEEKHERVEACKTSLDSSAQDLIEEATKIKAKKIGREGEKNMSKEGELAKSNKITLKDIEKHLIRIERHVIRVRKYVKAQGVGGVGFTSMAAGMALVATGVQTTGGLVLFVVGLIVTLYSFYFM